MIPVIDSVWEALDGSTYRVILIANDFGDELDRVICFDVVTLQIRSGLLDDWHQNMTEVIDPDTEVMH